MRIFRLCLTIAPVAAFLSLAAPALAQSLEERAESWGRMHGNAIHCNDRGAHDFGVSAINYFKRKAGGGSRFEALREKYGQNFLNNSHKSPPGGCSRLRSRMNAALQEMRR